MYIYIHTYIETEQLETKLYENCVIFKACSIKKHLSRDVSSKHLSEERGADLGPNP